MKKRVISLILAMVLTLAFTPAFADTKVYGKADLQSLYDTVATYIFNSEEILKSTVTEEEDALCAVPILVAKKALLSPDFPEEHYDTVYRGLYSAFSMMSLVSQRNNSLNAPKVVRLLNALIGLITNDDYYKIAPVDLAENTRTVVEKSRAYIENPTLYAPDDMHAQMNQLFITLRAASEYKITDFNAKFGIYAFEDVLQSDWYFSAVDYVYREGLFKGTSVSSFSPGTEMTRGMFITVLSRFANADTAYAPAAFVDVHSDSYYAAPIYWANASGLLSWVEGDSFSPDSPITREEMVATMYNYLKYIAYDLSGIAPTPTENFPDISEASPFAAEPVGYAHAMGIISGYEDGSLKPKGTATRAEVAQVFINFENALY